MQPDQAGPTNARRASTAPRVSEGTGNEGLPATCRRQAHVIEALSEAVSVLRCSAAALKAENADLRAASDRVRVRGGGSARATGRSGVSEAVEVPLALDLAAPAAARVVVADCLRGRVAASVLADAQLAVSELVSNSVAHSGVSAAGVVAVRVRLTSTIVRLEVADPGRGGEIAPRSPDLKSGGGFGLGIVHALSERWGLERVVAGGTRVWAQLPRAPQTAPPLREPSGLAVAPDIRNRKPSGGRTAATRRREPAEGTA